MLLFIFGCLLVAFVAILLFPNVSPIQNPLVLISVALAVRALIPSLLTLGEHDEVALHENGLRYTKWGHTRVALWEDIRSVTEKKFWLRRYGWHVAYILEIKRQKRMRLSNWKSKNMDVLGKTLQEEVNQRLLPIYEKALEEKGVVSFGPLSVSKQGIVRGKRTIPWERIEAVERHHDVIVIRQKGQWLLAWPRIAVTRITNPYVFLSMVKYMLYTRQRQYQADLMNQPAS